MIHRLLKILLSLSLPIGSLYNSSFIISAHSQALISYRFFVCFFFLFHLLFVVIKVAIVSGKNPPSSSLIFGFFSDDDDEQAEQKRSEEYIFQRFLGQRPVRAEQLDDGS